MLYKSDSIRKKCQHNYFYSQELYAALCNNYWCPNETMALLKDEKVIYTWREISTLVADLFGSFDQLDFYFSGLDHLEEGQVTAEIAQDLKKLGWVCVR